MNKPDKATRDAWHNDPSNWRFGVFYYNKADKRLLPPRRLKWMGWTVNFANPWSIALLVVIVLVMLIIQQVIRKYILR